MSLMTTTTRPEGAPTITATVDTSALLDKSTRSQAMRDLITEISDRVGLDPADWPADLQLLAASLTRYSIRNQLLIYMQRPDATLVAGFRDWLGKGRAVRKGERAIWILAPITRRRGTDSDDSDDRSGIAGVRAVPVFDISQTDELDTEEN